jgi:hypothetical protein
MQHQIEDLNVMVRVLSEKYKKVIYADDEPNDDVDAHNVQSYKDYKNEKINYSSNDIQDYDPYSNYFYNMNEPIETLKRETDCNDSSHLSLAKRHKTN